MNALKIFGVAVLISAAVAAAPQAQEHDEGSNSGLQGLRDLELAKYREGVDVMFVYFGGDQIEDVDPGYYIVRLKGDVRDERGNFEARAELISVADQKVRKTVATHITVVDDDLEEGKCMTTPTGAVGASLCSG
jgi:hypothetical protein